MNKYLLTSTIIITSSIFMMPLTFANKALSCEQLYKQSENQFEATATASPQSISNTINQCLQTNFCANAQTPNQCGKTLRLYGSIAAFYAATNSTSTNNNSFAHVPQNTQRAQRTAQSSPPSSYNFTYKPPMQKNLNNSDYNNHFNNDDYANQRSNNFAAPAPNSQPSSENKNIYKNINF